MILRSARKWTVAALVAVALLQGGPGRAQSAPETESYVNFSFDQVELRLLAKLVGDMTGKRFVIGDGVNGKVTVVTPPKIPVSEVYPLFLTVLESSGFSVMEQDGTYRVVPLPERAVSAAPVVGVEESTPTEGVITKVIRVENISALELRKILEPMVRGGKAGALAAFGPTNHLIITDTAENIRRMEQIIAELDRPGAARVAEFVKLKNASAEEVAAQLGAAIQGSTTADKALSRHIQQVAEGAGGMPTDVTVVPSAAANSLVIVGTPVQIAEIKRIIEMMDIAPDTGSGRFNALFLKYLSAEEAAKNLNALLAKSLEKDARQKISIEPNVANNALLIESSPQDYEMIRTLIASLDQVPQQVMVEILIAEVSVGKNLDFGVDWATIDTPESGKTTAIGRSRPGESDTIMDVVSDAVFPQGLSIGIAQGVTVNANGEQVPKIPFLVHALAQNRDVNILSSVPLRAQNNTEAKVSVVENIPLLRSTIEGGSGTARDVIQNIDRVDVGIKLTLTPHVNPDRQITMQLNPSIEAIVDEGPTGTQFAPTIAKREVSTTVTVPNESTIIISGLIREDRTKVVNKVPILGDIPLLGMLFRNTVDKKQRTNLLIFVTPHIVTDAAEADKMEALLKERSRLDVSPTNVSVRASQRK
ncbi:MAG TPA: type II secretion system secretin GspD [Kiritimatiellia bacterium]|nr:type II secretion system secretin GspD [Kiritimatiellia bacterium]